jgi:hypothetical protein
MNENQENTVEVEVDDDVTENLDISATDTDSIVEEIQKEIQALEINSDDVLNNTLDLSKTSDMEGNDEILVEAVTQLNALNNITEPGTKSFLASLFGKVPGMKKAAAKTQKTYVENLSQKENIDRIALSIDSTIEHTQKDLDVLVHLQGLMDDLLINGSKSAERIETALVDLEAKGDRRGILTLQTLRNQLQSMNLMNTKTSSELDIMVKTSHASTTSLIQIKPLITAQLKIQTIIANQSARVDRTQTTNEVVRGVVNQMILNNQQSSQDAIIKTVELAHKPLISKETLDKTTVNEEDFVKKLQLTLATVSKDMQVYNDSMVKLGGKLNNSRLLSFKEEVKDNM